MGNTERENGTAQLLEYYRLAYEKEKEKNTQLAARLADAQAQAQDLDFKLKRIKNNPVWKATKPLRSVMHWMIRMKDRIVRLGSPRGIARKIKSKLIERKAMRLHGKASFPDSRQREEMRGTKFPRDITFSILVPLYNTPRRFLTEMIDSVRAQTYEKWELCLADGSGGGHGYGQA